MSAEGIDGKEIKRSRETEVLAGLDENSLTPEASLLKQSLLSLSDVKVAGLNTDRTRTKLDLLYSKSKEYDFVPKSLLSFRENIDPAQVNEVREKIRDYLELKGETKSMMQQEEVMAEDIASLLAGMEQGEFREAA